MLSLATFREYCLNKKGVTECFPFDDKKHWNTIIIDGSISDEKILFLVDLSFELVYNRLKKTEKEALQNYK